MGKNKFCSKKVCIYIPLYNQVDERLIENTCTLLKTIYQYAHNYVLAGYVYICYRPNGYFSRKMAIWQPFNTQFTVNTGMSLIYILSYFSAGLIQRCLASIKAVGLEAVELTSLQVRFTRFLGAELLYESLCPYTCK